MTVFWQAAEQIHEFQRTGARQMLQRLLMGLGPADEV